MGTLCRWCRWTTFLPLIVGLGLIAMVGGWLSVQSDVRDRTIGALAGEGLSDVQVLDVSYRDVSLTGPTNLEAVALSIVDGLDATHSVSYQITTAPGPADEEPATTSATSTANPAANVPSLGVTGTVTDGTIVVSGMVPDEATRQTIVVAAEDAFGAPNVTDRLAVEGPSASLELSLAASDLATLIGLFPDRLAEGEFALDLTFLTLSGQAASDDAAEALWSAFDRAPYVTIDADVGSAFAVDVGQVVEDIAALLVIRGITFESGSSEITAAGIAVVDEVATILGPVLAAGPGLLVEVGGHTDDQGQAEFNQTLSQTRAETVRSALLERGLPADGLTSVGYGEEEPIADNLTTEGRAQNRRIEFTIVED